MNSTVDKQNLDLATAAVMRAGHDQTHAYAIALQVVAERLIASARRMTDAAEYADRDDYYRERREAGGMILRARAMLREAQQLPKTEETSA